MVHTITSLEEYTRFLNSNESVVVDFTAAWCPPCRLITPKFESWSAQYPAAVFLKVDVDDVPDVAAMAEVSSMPTSITYKKGKEFERVVGAHLGRWEGAIVNVLAA
ncbi:Cytoplasmic thioredoxin isoenzyme 2 [Borealophlyctis nickersoniae]|nr:Cytoplasmic thioredoxin isoenzyme 2 [Borealophlyctis nickersoniae]